MYYNTPVSVNYHIRIVEDPLLSISKLSSKSAYFLAVLYYPSNGVEFSQFLNSNFVSFQCHLLKKVFLFMLSTRLTVALMYIF